MRSAELARLAGVTVRSLRHYHQIGVLDEPERSSNGYRHYGVHDLVRLLRIKHLAAVGIPLDRMPGLLDGADEDSATLLAELDSELAGQIDRLAGQRELIARLRTHEAPPDLPPELAPFFAMFAAADLSPELARSDREQSVLLAHFAGEEAIPHLVRLYERLAESDMLPAVTAIAARFGRLGPDSTEQEISSLADSFVETFDQVIAELTDATPPLDLGRSGDLITEYTADVHNEQQLRALEQFATRLGAQQEPDRT